MTRFPRTILLALLFALLALLFAPAHAQQATGLPDTGQDTCYDGTATLAPCTAANSGDAAPYPRQDGRYGRDPAAAAGALTKTGAGAKGFDYTKIANNGTTLAASVALGAAATDWACTQDNITGLTWEVKTATNTDLRYKGHTYTWYNSSGTTNGGNVGTANGGTCQTAGRCDTEKFVADVNAGSGLCGGTDWRMPTLRELLTLVYANGSNPSIDPTYFPNTQASYFWSGSSYAQVPTLAWLVSFADGSASGAYKTGSHYVRLVRGGQF